MENYDEILKVQINIINVNLRQIVRLGVDVL